MANSALGVLLKQGGFMGIKYLIASFVLAMGFNQALAIEVSGEIERVDFEFEAPRVRGINRQCLEFYDDENITSSVDDIYVSINGGSEKHLKNGPGWWSSAEEVCDQIVKHLRSEGFGKPKAKGCGTHAVGDSWYEADNRNPRTKEKACPAGKTGKIIVTKENLVEYKCTKRGVKTTGKEIAGKVLKRENLCRTPKRSCNVPGVGNVPHGGQWEKSTSEKVKKEVACGTGLRGKQNNVYTKTLIKQCNDGSKRTLREKLVLKKAGVCKITCAVAYGTNYQVFMSRPGGGRGERPMHVTLPGNVKPGTNQKVNCSLLVQRPFAETQALFKCNKDGLWEAGWDNRPRGRGETRPPACVDRSSVGK